MNNKQLYDSTSTQYTIIETVTASGLTTKALRYYEQIGLIPKALRSNSVSAPDRQSENARKS
ncbi:MAG: MerR family DNA-binding transcriptional regulator [Nitrosomonadaceae bacterium]